MIPRRFTITAARKRRWYARHREERAIMHAKGYRYSSGVWVPR